MWMTLIAKGMPMPRKSVARMTITISNGSVAIALRESLDAATRIVSDQPWNEDAKECCANLQIAVDGLTVKAEPNVAFLPLLIAVQSFAKLEGKEFAKIRELSQKALKQHRKGMTNGK